MRRVPNMALRITETNWNMRRTPFWRTRIIFRISHLGNSVLNPLNEDNISGNTTRRNNSSYIPWNK
jgi:hypothetical protein